MVSRFVAAFGALALFASPVVAQPSAWTSEQIRSLDAGGFDHAAEVLTFEGDAARGEEAKVRVEIPTAGSWALVGSCGKDCEDIGLVLDRAGGANVAEGVAGFAASLTPGAYDLHVGFDKCAQARCRYVVRAYRKP